MKKGRAYYVDAKDMAQKSLAEIEQLMGLINTELDKYRAQHSFDYAHAGSIKEIERQLGQVWEFVAETE